MPILVNDDKLKKKKKIVVSYMRQGKVRILAENLSNYASIL